MSIVWRKVFVYNCTVENVYHGSCMYFDDNRRSGFRRTIR